LIDLVGAGVRRPWSDDARIVPRHRRRARHATPRTPREKRASRILALISIIVVLSVADLLFTLTHLNGIGMIELNPIARAIILGGTATDLIAFKLASVGVGCGCLYLGRRSKRTELAAWICALGLGLLTVHWFQYNAVMQATIEQMTSVDDLTVDTPGWITLASGSRGRAPIVTQ
jgi:hypothetical protein